MLTLAKSGKMRYSVRSPKTGARSTLHPQTEALMNKLVKFVTVAEIADDAAILATILEGLVVTTAKSSATMKEHLQAAEWLAEIARHVEDAVPDSGTLVMFDDTDIGTHSALLLLSGSFDQVSDVVDRAVSANVDIDTLRRKAAGAYVSAAITARTMLAGSAYRPEMLQQMQSMETVRRLHEQRDPALPLRN